MKLYLLAVSLLFSLNKPAFSQSDSIKTSTLGNFFIFQFDVPLLDAHDLNTRLTDFGYPKAVFPELVAGFGLHLHIDKTLIHFSYVESSEEREYDLSMTETEYRSASFSVTYDLLNSTYWTLGPRIGFKGLGLNYIYRDKTNPHFNTYFRGNEREKEITSSISNFDTGIDISYQKQIQIGAKLGYLRPLKEQRWLVHNNTLPLEASPKVKQNIYFSVYVGKGFIYKQRQPPIRKPRPRTHYANL